MIIPSYRLTDPMFDDIALEVSPNDTDAILIKQHDGDAIVLSVGTIPDLIHALLALERTVEDLLKDLECSDG